MNLLLRSMSTDIFIKVVHFDIASFFNVLMLHFQYLYIFCTFNTYHTLPVLIGKLIWYYIINHIVDYIVNYINC